jgi:CRP-like cAMP-binding protein
MPRPPLSPTDLRRQLEAGSWFASVPEALKTWLLAHGQARALSAGQHLFSRGDAPDGLYAVLRGAMRISGGQADGQEALLTLLEPPHWFGEIALFDGAPRTHDAWAEGDCLLWWVPQAPLLALLQAEPAWWQPLARLLTQKLRLLLGVLEDQALCAPAERLARRLATMAQGYGAWQDRSQRVLQVSQSQLAQMLSLSRQTVNQTLKALETEGLIRCGRGTIEVLDVARLASR